MSLAAFRQLRCMRSMRENSAFALVRMLQRYREC
ncbi:hypothetical protein T06_16484 [Trichinella sp. T6]|nr:hypothetical protein T06_12005 [Trichinella sp. T6]KRX39577.1 hypothetical protein T06_16484 [Trichinella sp. T6]